MNKEKILRTRFRAVSPELGGDTLIGLFIPFCAVSRVVQW